MADLHLRKEKKEVQEWFRSQTESRWELPTFGLSGYCSSLSIFYLMLSSAIIYQLRGRQRHSKTTTGLCQRTLDISISELVFLIGPNLTISIPLNMLLDLIRGAKQKPPNRWRLTFNVPRPPQRHIFLNASIHL